MTTDHQADPIEVPDVTCPKCKDPYAGFQGVRHRGGGLRAIYKCSQCDHTWPRRKIPEGAVVPDKPEPRVQHDGPQPMTDAQLARQAHERDRSAAHQRFRSNTLGRYVAAVLATSGAKRLAFFDAHPIREIFTGPRW